MVVGVTGPTNHTGIAGPGIPLTVTLSNAAATIGVNVQLVPIPAGGASIGFWSFNPPFAPTNQLVLGVTPFTSVVTDSPAPFPVTDDQVLLQVQAEMQGGTTDQGQGQFNWDGQSGVGNQQQLLAQQAQQQGFTDQDRLNLEQTTNDSDSANQNTQEMLVNWSDFFQTLAPQIANGVSNTLSGITTAIQTGAGQVFPTIGQLFSGKALDLITLEDFGSACAPDLVDANLGGGNFYGVQMQCTTYPDYIVFTGAGDNYTIQSLGTLEITRGGNVIVREGLHNLSKMIYPLPGVPLTEIAVSVPIEPGDYFVKIEPATGCCWALQGMKLP